MQGAIAESNAGAVTESFRNWTPKLELSSLYTNILRDAVPYLR
jgi:hypothetical protein